MEKTILFYAFSVIMVFAALRVITDRNPVHAALYLVLTFFSAASVWMLLQAEFLAIVLVLVYVGAVMVLFLFVVMMLDINIEKMREGFWKSLWVAVPVGLLIVFEMSAVMMRGFWEMDAQASPAGATVGMTRELGKVLYTQYIFPFEIAGVILLVAIVAAVALTMRKRKDTKYFAPGDAVKVKSTDRLRIVKMKSESVRPVAEAAVATAAAEPVAEKK
ncbi:MAG TPA: NADH-quinone oxidoreductase subunit J [Burkholderiaceae bacterium]|jgi:NADH-quinone oxidoreductase subunit J